MRVDPYSGSNDVYRRRSLIGLLTYKAIDQCHRSKGLNLAWDCWVTVDEEMGTSILDYPIAALTMIRPAGRSRRRGGDTGTRGRRR